MIFFDNREASQDAWTKVVRYYDYRTNIHHTLKKKPMRYEHLSDFIECYKPPYSHRRMIADLLRGFLPGGGAAVSAAAGEPVRAARHAAGGDRPCAGGQRGRRRVPRSRTVRV